MTDALPVVLTSRDFALLENLVHNWGEPFAGAGEFIRRKLRVATLVFPTDVPTNVVTLNSRVRFRVGNAQPEEWTIVGGPSEADFGMTLPLASPRGLALIGAAVGQTVEARLRDCSTELLLIEALPYRPEQRRPAAALRVVSRQELPDADSLFPPARARVLASRLGGDDDPGPSAA